MSRQSQVELSMNTRGKVVDAVEAMMQIGDIHRLLTRSHLHGIISTLGTTESILNASGKHHTQAIAPESVADAQTSDEVGSRSGMALQLYRTIFEIAHLCLIVFSESLVRRLLGIVGTVAGKIISTLFPEIITRSDGSICLNLETGRSILHHHVHHTSSCIAFHIGSQRLGYHEAVHQVAWEDI